MVAPVRWLFEWFRSAESAVNGLIGPLSCRRFTDTTGECAWPIRCRFDVVCSAVLRANVIRPLANPLISLWGATLMNDDSNAMASAIHAPLFLHRIASARRPQQYIRRGVFTQT